ncbi:hypothetical protein JCM19379_24080 [Methyloparacoccus murrellii]
MIKTLVRALRQAGLRPRVAEPCLRLRRLAVAAAPPVSLPAPPATGERAGLRALTAAALALPGLAQAPAATAAPGDAASFEYGYYKQTPWKLLGGLKSQYSPLQVDNIEANGMITLEDRWKFGFNYAQDTWSGATPVASAPYALGGNNPTPAGASPLIRGNGSILYDRNLSPYALDEETATYVPDNRLVQTVASASVEVRNQGDFRLGYEWDEAAVNVGGGVSQEPDYNSAFGSLNGRMDFNQKLTSANLGLSYTNSDIYALINPLYAPYVNKSYYASRGQIQTETDANGGVTQHLTGNRQDWATHLSVAQVMNKDLLLESGIGFTRSTGFLANPYKAVDMLYVDTNSAPFIGPDFGLPDLWAPVVEGVIERRPEERNQGIWDIRLVQYVDALDASLHGGYRFFIDSWGISAHTFDVDWVQPIGEWSVTPRFRYYSQNAASFYEPYFLFSGAAPTAPSGQFNLAGVPLDAYSSDYRLSAYGALSTGVTVARPLGKALAFEAGFEFYTHSGDLRLGGAGLGSWSNFDYYQFNAALKVDLSAASTASLDLGDDPHAHHHHHHEDHRQQHLGMDAPSGILFNHMLAKAGDTMVGVRYSYMLQQGGMYQGTRPVGDLEIVNRGCGPFIKCTYKPREMDMSMAMLDLMYAPTDWLTLMLMPQFMSMDMHLTRLDGAPPPSPEDIHASHGGNPFHSTGGVGDIVMAGMVKLHEEPGHKVHLTLGFTAPTGSVNERVNGNSEFEHYGMQLGSGTWSIWPSLSYNGYEGDFNWGTQLSTLAPLESYNDSGFAFGTLFQTTAWGGYQIKDWLSGSLRALYTFQDAIDGQYPKPFVPTGPMDTPQSYGGQYLDIGFGLNAMVMSGDFAGNHFGIEWLQPAYNDYNGYQMERTGTLWASWGLSF